MRAGNLRQRVAIQNYTETRDAMGHPIQSYSTVATVYAAVEPIKGREFFAAEQVQSDTDVRIRMRYRDDITIDTRSRVTHETHTYDVMNVIHVSERHRELHLMCKERHQDGDRG